MHSRFPRYVSSVFASFTMICLSAISAQAGQSALSSSSEAQPTISAADVLRATLKAEEGINSIEYEVREVANRNDASVHHSRTTILAARSPFRYRARTVDEDDGSTELAIMDGNTLRASTGGEVDERPAFALDGQAQVILNRASGLAASTWRLLLDREYLSAAINSGKILLAGKDDIDGELCDIVLYVRFAPELSSSGSFVNLFWISTKTGLPRATQQLSLMRGASGLARREVISIHQINPPVPEGTFTYKPVAADSSSAPASPSSAIIPSLQGKLPGTRLADLEVKDASYKSVKLSEFTGTPLLVTFWAPWCGPCNGELETLARLEPKYKDRLRVLAIAVQDSRLNVESWMKAHPEYHFTFVTDPELPSQNSRLVVYSGSPGIPVTLLVDGNGTVNDQWFGYDKPEELEKKLTQFLSPSSKH